MGCHRASPPPLEGEGRGEGAAAPNPPAGQATPLHRRHPRPPPPHHVARGVIALLPSLRGGSVWERGPRTKPTRRPTTPLHRRHPPPPRHVARGVIAILAIAPNPPACPRPRTAPHPTVRSSRPPIGAIGPATRAVAPPHDTRILGLHGIVARFRHARRHSTPHPPRQGPTDTRRHPAPRVPRSGPRSGEGFVPHDRRMDFSRRFPHHPAPGLHGFVARNRARGHGRAAAPHHRLQGRAPAGHRRTNGAASPVGTPNPGLHGIVARNRARGPRSSRRSPPSTQRPGACRPPAQRRRRKPRQHLQSRVAWDRCA